jgi:phosphoenolpyruvate carboxykinase (ATP)
MENRGPFVSGFGLERQGLAAARCAYWNLPPAQLVEHAVRRGEALLGAHGPLVARTGAHTGRSPQDKFIVQGGEAAAHVWWGKVNRPIAQARFDALRARLQAHWAGRDLFVFDGYAGADPAYRMPVRVVTELAWHNLFARNIFRREADGGRLLAFEPRFTVFAAPSLEAEPERDGTGTGTFILLDLEQHQVLIGGTAYAGEIKKSIFSAMNYYLPRQGVLSMHCSANYGVGRDDVALFFGLSGTGKTTLSADASRTLVGDDEHGWSDGGVFNVEGGCYAKVIRLSAEGEPEIWATTRRFGTVLENVAMDPETRELDLDDDRTTENTRACYAVEQIANADPTGCAGHPRHVVFLTADAFGVLPPIARLTEPQALYHFLSGYTAKVAGTERGVTEPQATFSACFGAPFMPLHPGVYAGMLGERLRRHEAKAWLVNTGWTGGPHGVGRRMPLAHTRRMVAAALAGELEGVPTAPDPVFGLGIPAHVPGVPGEVLQPRATWPDPTAYDARAAELAGMFAENFRPYASGTSEAVRAAGPRL